MGWIFLHEGLTADYTAEPLQHARALESSEVYGFSALAARYGGHIALGLNELWQGQAFISTVFCGPDPQRLEARAGKTELTAGVGRRGGVERDHGVPLVDSVFVDFTRTASGSLSRSVVLMVAEQKGQGRCSCSSARVHDAQVMLCPHG